MALYEINPNAMRGSGTFFLGRAGETLGRAKLVYKGANGAWFLADADALATLPTLGMTLDTARVAGQIVRVLKEGYLGVSTWAWTTGGKIYASTVAGELTQIPPAGLSDTIQRVGVASRTNMILFDPQGAGGTGCAILQGATAYVGTDECRGPFANYFLVSDFADDKAAIEAAAAYAGTLGGGIVHLEPRTYTADVDIDEDEIILEGEGWDTIIDGSTTGHAINLTGDRGVIRDLTVRTTPGATNAFNGININGGLRFRIINVKVNGSDNRGIDVVGTSNGGIISECYIFDPDSDGIRVEGGQCIISNNEIQQCGQFGVSITTSGDNTSVVGNFINTTGDDGININTNAENCIVDGNRITAWTNECIDDDSGTSTIGDNECT